MEKVEALYKLLKSRSFKETKKEISSYFNDYYEIYSNNCIELKFISSKSFKTIDIKNIESQANWEDLALLKALIYKEDNLNKVVTFDEYIDFLIHEIDNIIKLYDNENYQSTNRKLQLLKQQRLSQMFPKIF
jgi:hypothetical protein